MIIKLPQQVDFPHADCVGILYQQLPAHHLRLGTAPQAWSMEHWVCLRTLHGRHDDTTWTACLALSSDGTLLASGSTGPFGASTIKVGPAVLP